MLTPGSSTSSTTKLTPPLPRSRASGAASCRAMPGTRMPSRINSRVASTPMLRSQRQRGWLKGCSHQAVSTRAPGVRKPTLSKLGRSRGSRRSSLHQTR